MSSPKEIWDSLSVDERVALCVRTEVVSGKIGSALWEQVDARQRAHLIPLLVELDGGSENGASIPMLAISVAPSEKKADTDPTDRTVHAGWAEGKPVYRASMAGRCIKELFLWRVGMGEQLDAENRAQEQGAAEGQFRAEMGYEENQNKGFLGAKEGSRHEAWIIEDLINQGYELAWVGDDQQHLERKYKRYIVRSHPDGMIRGRELGEEWHVLECKALHQDNYLLWKTKRWEAFQKYAYQVSIEMDLSTFKGFFVVKNRNTGQFEKNIIEKPPIEPALIYRKFSLIEDIIEATEDGVEPAAPNCPENAEWFFCPFFDMGACDVLQGKDAEDIEEIDDPDFEEILIQYKGFKSMEKQAVAGIEALKVAIKARLINPKLKVGKGPHPFFVAHTERTRTGFDANAAKEALAKHGEDIEQFTYSNSYMELRVTGGPKEEADKKEEGESAWP